MICGSEDLTESPHPPLYKGGDGGIRFEIKKGGDLMAIDPVCKMTVSEEKAAARTEYKGKTYYFCAKVCKEKFEKEPEKYIGKK